MKRHRTLRRASRIFSSAIFAAGFFVSPLSIGVLGIALLDQADAVAVDYQSQVKPLLEEKCYSCHGRLRQESGLRVDTRGLMVQGGDSGTALVPHDVGNSLLIERVAASEADRMPPADEGPALKPDQIALLKEWIRTGAEAPDEEIPKSPKDHWAFRPIPPPETLFSGQTQSSGKTINPVDALLQKQRDRFGLQTVAPAERSILIRRVYLDLIGLPPTTDELADQRPWDEIVDDLLSRPQHGERWARHWMDIWRYSDNYGLGAQLRYSQKHLWHWRDWIVDALNDDKGYDRMITEMLAGDEISPNDPETIRATGFLARNYYLFNRTTWLDSTIEHSSKAFLGLTVNCAKCHDHKYDPISQVDYYRMRAIFEPHQVRLDPVPGVTDFEKDGLPRVFDDHLDAETFLHVRGDPKNPDRDQKMQPGIPEFFAASQPEIAPIDLPPFAYAPTSREYVQHDQVKKAERELAVAEQDLAKALDALSRQPDPPDEPGEPLDLNDDFDSHDTTHWKLIGDGWMVRDGKLVQTVANRDSQSARLVPKLPVDFELECRYTTTGGPTYRSVTFRFDESDDARYDNYVYTSAHAPGPKLQIAYRRDGKNVYPAAGRKAMPIEIGKPITLRFAVRGSLINVWVDGKFALAYRFPDRRSSPRLTLAPFDATVDYDWIKIRSLDPGTKLQTPKGDPGETADAESQVAVARAKKKVAESRLAEINAIGKANELRFDELADESQRRQTANAALRRQIETAIATARLDLLVAGEDTKKQKAANSKLADAQSRLGKVKDTDIDFQPIVVTKKSLESPAHKESDYPAEYARQSTGRRLALARWITEPGNPLTARVAVNHVWLRHFGKPLVDSVFDFGLRAPEPPQSELLDYLAGEFMRSGWSFRHLHRLIVTSEAYRLSTQSGTADSATRETDAANDHYWRMNTRRMDAQTLRDSLLHLSDHLDLTIGGPSLAVSGNSNRRSLYFRHSRDDKHAFLKMFDDADLLQCYRRVESVVPQQALALSNSMLAFESAERIVDRVQSIEDELEHDEFSKRCFQILLARSPTSEEISECLRFFDEWAKLDTTNHTSKVSPRVALVHALLNHNDFISIR